MAIDRTGDLVAVADPPPQDPPAHDDEDGFLVGSARSAQPIWAPWPPRGWSSPYGGLVLCIDDLTPRTTYSRATSDPSARRKIANESGRNLHVAQTMDKQRSSQLLIHKIVASIHTARTGFGTMR